MLNFFPLALISLPAQILSISLPTKPPHLTHSSSPSSLLLQQSINPTLPKVIRSIQKEAISGRNESLPSFRRAFSLYDQINLIEKVPEDQLRFQGYTETGFTVNGIEREGSLLCIGNFLLSWASTTLSQVAIALEKAALSDEYFVKRKLYPNVDFYSGLIYRAMGFPTEFFPVLFTIPRMAGYLAHWRESLDDPVTKIMRPQQVYIGEWLRHYMPLKERIAPTDTNRLGQVSISNASRRRLAGSGFKLPLNYLNARKEEK